MTITAEDLQRRRSPKDLHDFAHRVRYEASVDLTENSRAFTHKGLYKEFVDEILPLSDFALLQYPETYGIQPVLGPQGYDALVYDETNREIDRIEIKKPHDGAERAENGRLLVSRGFGQSEDPVPDESSAFVPFVLATCQAAILKDYTDCTLVIVVPVPESLPPFQDQYEVNLRDLVRRVADFAFKAKRVFVFIPPCHLAQVPQVSS